DESATPHTAPLSLHDALPIFKDRRDEALIRLLIDCGLRVSEVTGIDLDHLDLDNESVEVTGKGSRKRFAYFGAKTGQALDRYIRSEEHTSELQSRENLVCRLL